MKLKFKNKIIVFLDSNHEWLKLAGKGSGKAGGSNQPARHSTGTLTNDKNDGKKGGKGGTKKGR